MEKLYGVVLGWLMFVASVSLASTLVWLLIDTFLKPLFSKAGKENSFVIYYQKCEDYLNKNVPWIMLYPLALIGKYFLEYVPFLIILLEYIFIFKLFQMPISMNFVAGLVCVLLITVGCFCAFKTATFLISLYEAFYKKIPNFLHFGKGDQKGDKVGAICSFLIICYVVVQSLWDEKSFLRGFIRWVEEGLSQMSLISIFLLTLAMAVITYKHVEVMFLKKERADRSEKEKALRAAKRNQYKKSIPK